MSCTQPSLWNRILKFSFYGVVASIALFVVACSDERAVSVNECPKDALCLYKSVSSTQSIMPNAYKASIKITESDTLRKGGEIESSTKKDIANTLNEIIVLSKEKGFCEGGNHDLRPNIQYKDGAARDTVGYTLSFNLECDVPTEEKKSYDEFISSIDKKIDKNKYLNFISPNVNIIATPEAWQEAQDKAFNAAIALAQKSAQEYSKTLQKKCTLANADSGSSPIVPREFAKLSNMSVAEDTSWELPTPKEQEVSAKIQVKYICR